jgi:uncharacterized protein
VTRVLLVPGRGLPKPEHWLNRWLQVHPEYRWVSRGEDPDFDLDIRVTALRGAIEADPAPAVLVAHSGGCITVATWAAAHSGPVRGALLVAPPYVDGWRPSPDVEPLRVPRAPLPFPTIVVASRTDPHATFEQARDYADAWGARLVDAGDAGHIATADGYGPWPAGERLLAELH